MSQLSNSSNPKLTDFVFKVVNEQNGKLKLGQRISHPIMSAKYLKALAGSAREADLKKIAKNVYGGEYHNGQITVTGNVGDHSAGFSMVGGKIIVNGNAGDYAGAPMKNGKIKIDGDNIIIENSDGTVRQGKIPPEKP